MAPRKRPALQPNGLNLAVEHNFPSATEVSYQNGGNSYETMQKRSAMTVIQEQLSQHQHHHEHQQRTLVKTRSKNSDAMTSTTTTSTSSSSSSIPMQSKRIPLMKHWQDELLEFSTQITWQAQSTLSRIAIYFRANGMKFDTDFRNHFSYISNNRILESYDSFLIGLPREMKCDEYQIQRPAANSNVRTYIQPKQQQLMIEAPPAKRKRIEGNSENAATMYTINDSTKSNQQLAVIEKRPTVQPSHMSKIGSQISIQKVTSSSKQSGNVTSATNTIAKFFEIKKVHSLYKEPVVAATAVANDSLNGTIRSDDQQKKTITGRTIENGPAISSAKKIRFIPTSKIPGRRMKVLIPTDQVNAQSTPHKPTTASELPQDPLAIDTSASTAAETTTELTIEPSINAQSVHPAFLSEITVLKTNKQLSTSLPMASSVSATPAAAPTTPSQPHGILTRSRIKLEQPKPLYKCDSCAFTSEVKQNLMRHNLLVHTGKKPQICKTCKKRFPSKSLLLTHMREYHHELHSDLAYWDTN